VHPIEPMPQIEDCQNLVVDLYNLLEGHAPPWYSHELHNRLVAALKTSDTTDDAEAMLVRNTGEDDK
jgi:hypothetical protein